jgi:oligoendopeptidase F
MSLITLLLAATPSCHLPCGGDGDCPPCKSEKCDCGCGKSSPDAAATDQVAETADEPSIVIPARKDVDAKFKWHTEDLFASDAAWETAFENISKEITNVAAFKGTLAESGGNILALYEYNEKIGTRLEHLFAYASLKRDEDTRATDYQALYNKIYSLYVKFGAASSYITPEILAIPEETIREFIAGTEGLKMYEHDLEDTMRQREHILSEKEEALLAAAGNVFRAPSDAFGMLTNADMTFPEIENEKGEKVNTSNSLYYVFRGSADRKLREANEKAYHGQFRNFRSTLASLMRSNVQKGLFTANIRGYESALHAALDGANIPVGVYTNLIDSVNANLDSLHRYAALRKKILGVDELHGYDLYNTLFPDADMKVSFEEARELLAVGLKPLGKDYMDAMMNGIDSGWIDIYENEGKRSGAYSAGIYGVHPFVLLNYHDRLEDAFTLAHELGHSMHSWHSQKFQPKVYSGYSIFNAEVASTTNEALLVNHLLKVTTDRKERLFLLDFYLDSIRNTFYRQTLFAEFELTVYTAAAEGKPLTADYFDEVYGGLVQKYYGPAFTLDKYKAAEWSRIPHFYRNFYVYTYATGYSAAAAFSKRILEQGDSARDLYIEHFLSGGSSDYSTELLKKAGVDMTSPEPVVALSQLFGQLVDELEKLIDG